MPNPFPAVQIRIARPTDKLDEVVRFYRDGLGLPVIASFQAHAGYDGVMLGLPSSGVHLEFTHHEQGSPCPAPTADNLLVLYIPNQGDIDTIAARFAAIGYHPIPPENPYWEGHSLTIADPDGWRVVLMNTAGI